MMKSILMVASFAYRGSVQRCRTIVGLMILIALIVVPGCSEGPDQKSDQSSSQKQSGVAGKDNNEKPRTVVVNKGMSKKEEKKPNERLDELEKKLEEQNKKGSQATASSSAETSQPELARQQVEDQVRIAAEAYYREVEARNWGYTYDHLDSETQSAFTENEWFAKNDWLADSGSATYTIQSIDMDDSS